MAKPKQTLCFTETVGVVGGRERERTDVLNSLHRTETANPGKE